MLLNCSNKSTRQYFSFAAASLFVFASLLLLNYLYPICGDDYYYSLQYETDRPISSLSDIFDFQVQHYLLWGGRSVLHIIAQILLLVGDPIADIINSLAYLALVWTVYLVANAGKKPNVLLFLAIHLFFYLLQPAIGYTFLWRTGSANYLWGCLLRMAFLLPLWRYAEQVWNGKETIREANTLKTVLKSIALFLFGILAGWTNENASAAMLPVLLVTYLFARYRHIAVPAWVAWGIAGFFAGTVAMLAAPGNFIRYTYETDGAALGTDYWLRQAGQVVLFFQRNCLSFAFVVALAFCLLSYFPSNTIDKAKAGKQGLFFLAFALLTLAALAGSPLLKKGPSIGVNILMITAAGCMLAHVDWKNRFVRTVSIVALTFGCLFFLRDVYSGCRELTPIKECYASRERLIAAEKAKGNSEIVFTRPMPPNLTHERYFHAGDPALATTGWLHTVYCRYYGFSDCCLNSDSVPKYE